MPLVLGYHDSVIPFVRFQSELFERLEHLFLEFLDLRGEDNLCGGGRIDTVGFDGDYDMAAVLQEVMSIESDNTSLIRLGNISEDNVNQ